MRQAVVRSQRVGPPSAPTTWLHAQSGCSKRCLPRSISRAACLFGSHLKWTCPMSLASVHSLSTEPKAPGTPVKKPEGCERQRRRRLIVPGGMIRKAKPMHPCWHISMTVIASGAGGVRQRMPIVSLTSSIAKVLDHRASGSVVMSDLPVPVSCDQPRWQSQ